MPEGFVESRVQGRPKRFPIVFTGPRQTFKYSPDRIESQLVSAMSPLLRDLLEVACAVLAADSEFSRGGPVRNNMGEAWSRDLDFTLPVRCLDTWTSPAVKQALVDAVEFLTGDRVTFRFVARQDDERSIEFLPFESSGNPFQATEVILFSGGLDSFAGALEAFSTREGNVVLVTHRSAQKAITRQVRLGDYLKRRSPGRVLHIQIQATRKGHEGRESTQRSRSLLFAALGYAVARMLGASKVSFYENGIVSQNLPISPQVIGTMATRTTHPLSLVKLEHLLHALDDARIPIRNGFEWLTKKEVVEKIATHGATDYISTAVSCTRLRDQDKVKTHCGECSQCLDRRFAILAAGLASHDHSENYATDVLLGQRDTAFSRTMAVDWSRHAWRLADLSISDFYTTFASEMSRVLEGHPLLPLDEALRRSQAMQRRHSEVVRSVLRGAAAGILDTAIPDTALLKLFGMERLVAGNALPATRGVSPTPDERLIPGAEATVFDPVRPEVAFYFDKGRHVVEVAHLGAVAGAPATVPHALKVPFEEDRDAGRDPDEFRYIPPGRIALPGKPDGSPKGAVHKNVSRCRRGFEEFFTAISDDPLPENFLIQTRGNEGYRLDPAMRIIGRHQVPATAIKGDRISAPAAPSAERDDPSARGA